MRHKSSCEDMFREYNSVAIFVGRQGNYRHHRFGSTFIVCKDQLYARSANIG